MTGELQGRAIVVLALGLAGCPTPPPPSQFPNGKAALDRMKATYACANGIQGEGKIDHFGERGRVRGNVLLFAVNPARVRIDVLSPFGAKTGRNTPSASAFIFALAAWLRSLIRPEPGTALAYLDYEQQEFGIAAALSRDLAMMDAYRSGDPYLAFARQAGAVPADAMRGTHGAIREQFKTCALGVQYGMGAEALANRLSAPLSQARELLQRVPGHVRADDKGLQRGLLRFIGDFANWDLSSNAAYLDVSRGLGRICKA